MADHHVSLWLDQLVAGSDLHLHFVDAEGRNTGAPVPAARPEPVHVEVPGGAGGFDWQKVAPPVSLAVDNVADHASAVHAFAGATLLAAMPLAAAAPTKPGPPAARKAYNAGGRWKLLVVSEGFATQAAFFAATDQLNKFIVESPPFNDVAVSPNFAMEALFWPSGPAGLFNTKVDGRLVFGDNALVNSFVKKSGSSGKLVVVLVNKPVRGGAGGGKDRPAWVTTTSAPTETWEAVALHELGHSFGLADEYDDASQTTPEPNPLEPNVSKEMDAAKTSWAARRTPGHPAVPTCPAGAPAPLGVVGTFEGARYRKTGRYRPTAECLMQRTDKGFCEVCKAHIAATI